jgi:hypothetical protein
MGRVAAVSFGRVLAILVGLVLAVFGFLTMMSSGLALALVGFDNTISTGKTDLETPTAAIAADVGGLGGDASDQAWGDDSSIELRLRAATDGDQALFAGVGPTKEVEAYLDRAPWDQLDSLSSGRFSSSVDDVDYTRKGRRGDPRELAAPTEQSFWSDSATGKDVALDWKFKSGDYTVVLMNADGSADVASTGSAAVEVPRLSWALLFAAVVGLVLLLIGLLFLFKIGRHRGASRRAVAVPAT